MMRDWFRSVALVSAVMLAVVSRSPAGAQQRRVIRITAERFAFTPSEIVLTAGEEVELRLSSDDPSHGFRIAGTNVGLIIPKRGRKEASVVYCPTEPGRYTFECTKMCGAGHNFMRGVIVVKAR